MTEGEQSSLQGSTLVPTLNSSTDHERESSLERKIRAAWVGTMWDQAVNPAAHNLSEEQIERYRQLAYPEYDDLRDSDALDSEDEEDEILQQANEIPIEMVIEHHRELAELDFGDDHTDLLVSSHPHTLNKAPLEDKLIPMRVQLLPISILSSKSSKPALVISSEALHGDRSKHSAILKGLKMGIASAISSYLSHDNEAGQDYLALVKQGRFKDANTCFVKPIKPILEKSLKNTCLSDHILYGMDDRLTSLDTIPDIQLSLSTSKVEDALITESARIQFKLKRHDFRIQNEIDTSAIVPWVIYASKSAGTLGVNKKEQKRGIFKKLSEVSLRSKYEAGEQ